ncbi:hypothetical protein ACWEKU_12770 [Streptomyces californicus]
MSEIVTWWQSASCWLAEMAFPMCGCSGPRTRTPALRPLGCAPSRRKRGRDRRGRMHYDYSDEAIDSYVRKYGHPPEPRTAPSALLFVLE